MNEWVNVEKEEWEREKEREWWRREKECERGMEREKDRKAMTERCYFCNQINNNKNSNEQKAGISLQVKELFPHNVCRRQTSTHSLPTLAPVAWMSLVASSLYKVSVCSMKRWTIFCVLCAGGPYTAHVAGPRSTEEEEMKVGPLFAKTICTSDSAHLP